MGHWRRSRPAAQRYPRVDTRVTVRISTVDPEADPDTGELFYRSTEETTANLSKGGAFVRSWEPLASGRRVLVEVDLPDEPPIRLVARVAWTRRRIVPQQATAAECEPGYGVEFVSGTRSELAALDRFLEGVVPASRSSSRASRPLPPAQAEPSADTLACSSLSRRPTRSRALKPRSHTP
ncbi:MAG: PilZ domain-containing protein [Deltaproteobacteria bacterium]|jgi:Tfp pilus assembly protein PilZ|nr:PilZ domain-containing protein [Deltaproteobacteria bacterium]MBW2501168.1 PilZ domain-containing protein [Deltaproteobacteria bacterium]